MNTNGSSSSQNSGERLVGNENDALSAREGALGHVFRPLQPLQNIRKLQGRTVSHIHVVLPLHENYHSHAVIYTYLSRYANRPGHGCSLILWSPRGQTLPPRLQFHLPVRVHGLQAHEHDDDDDDSLPDLVDDLPYEVVD